MLRPTHPLFEEYPHLPKLFIYDEEQLKADQFSIKRIQFIADALVEIPDIRVMKGVTQDILKTLGVTEIVSQDTPSQDIKERLAASQVEWVPEEAFVSYSGSLKRFMGFWRAIEPQLIEKSAREAMKPAGRRAHRA